MSLAGEQASVRTESPCSVLSGPLKEATHSIFHWPLMQFLSDTISRVMGGKRQPSSEATVNPPIQSVACQTLPPSDDMSTETGDMSTGAERADSTAPAIATVHRNREYSLDLPHVSRLGEAAHRRASLQLEAARTSLLVHKSLSLSLSNNPVVGSMSDEDREATATSNKWSHRFVDGLCAEFAAELAATRRQSGGQRGPAGRISPEASSSSDEQGVDAAERMRRLWNSRRSRSDMTSSVSFSITEEPAIDPERAFVDEVGKTRSASCSSLWRRDVSRPQHCAAHTLSSHWGESVIYNSDPHRVQL